MITSENNSYKSLEKSDSGFNIRARYNELLDEPIWILSNDPMPPEVVDRIEQAYFETRCMFICENPMILTSGGGRIIPKNGQIARGVFVCQPGDFHIGKCSVFNNDFWKKCLGDTNMIDTFYQLGDLLKDNSDDFVEKLTDWSRSEGLHCFNVFLGD